MYRMFLAAAAFAMATGLLGSAGAATMSTPPAPQASAYRTVADAWMTVSTQAAHLREKPTTSSKILGTLKHGTKVDVMGKAANGQWAHVKADKMEGYVDMKLLK